MKRKMVQVEVRVFATLRRYLPGLDIGQALVLQVEPGTTLDELRAELGLPKAEVKVIMRKSHRIHPRCRRGIGRARRKRNKQLLNDAVRT